MKTIGNNFVVPEVGALQEHSFQCAFIQKLFFVLILLMKEDFQRCFKTKNADTYVSALK